MLGIRIIPPSLKEGAYMTNPKKERPKHLGRGLAALLNPIILDNQPISPPPTGGLLVNMADTAVGAVVAAMPALPPDQDLRNALRQLPLEVISANPYQPRTEWDQQQLAELAESIKANGVIQPIIVRPVAGGQYQIIAGERRFRASQLVGIKTVPAVVREATDAQMLEIALVENIHRTNLNPIERAKAYQNYLKTFNLNQVEAAARLGEDRSVVSNYLRLLDLPEEVKKMLVSGELSMGHARAILSLPTDELRRKLANRAMAGRLSVREVERLVRKYTVSTSDNNGLQRVVTKAPNIVDLENKLRRELGTKVEIQAKRNGQRGKIVIEFYCLDDFERILQRVGIEDLEEV
jgi:ParB family transcriptional regulator, chromosome partitioning protein